MNSNLEPIWCAVSAEQLEYLRTLDSASEGTLLRKTEKAKPTEVHSARASGKPQAYRLCRGFEIAAWVQIDICNDAVEAYKWLRSSQLYSHLATESYNEGLHLGGSSSYPPPND